MGYGRISGVVLCLLGATTEAVADEMEALSLPAVTHDSGPSGRAVRGEVWHHHVDWQGDAVRPSNGGRLAMDWRQRFDTQSGSLTVSDRLELARYEGEAWNWDRWRNSLRELYLSHSWNGRVFVDAGRINFRQGVAMGYNPTDVFKQGAVVSRLSEDPASLRENRLGTVLLRAQRLWDGGAATLAWAPRLARDDDAGLSRNPWDLELGRTNRQDAWLAAMSTRPAPGLSLGWLISRRAGERVRLGIDASAAVGGSLVVNTEWSGVVQRSLEGQVATMGKRRYRHHAAMGATWTTPWGPSLTLEHHVSQSGLTRKRWNKVRRSDAGDDRELVHLLAARAMWQQEPLTRQSSLARVGWNDAFGVRGLELAVLGKYNPYDRSALWQFETHWHVDAWTVSAMMTGWAGGDNTQYGGSARSQAWSVRAARHF